jgi:hypothetical protein
MRGGTGVERVKHAGPWRDERVEEGAERERERREKKKRKRKKRRRRGGEEEKKRRRKRIPDKEGEHLLWGSVSVSPPITLCICSAQCTPPFCSFVPFFLSD